MKKLLVFFIVAAATILSARCEWVSAMSFSAQQRYPWNGLVDLHVTITGAVNAVKATDVHFSAINAATRAALPVTHLTEESAPTGSGTIWTRKFVWDAAADLGAIRIADVELTVEVNRLPGVQLWEGGPYWTECNVGATKPEGYGYYFIWGDAVGCTRYDAKNKGWVSAETGKTVYLNDDDVSIYQISLDELVAKGYTDSTGNLLCEFGETKERQAYGVTRRMPTAEELYALSNNCTIAWTTTNGVNGCLVSGKGEFASKSIFLPLAGQGEIAPYGLYQAGSIGNYWSSTACTNAHIFSCCLWMSDQQDFKPTYTYRNVFGSIRTVLNFVDGGDELVHVLSTHLPVDTRTGTRYARIDEPIAFSTDWGASVTHLALTVDGVEALASTVATNGVYAWRPDFSTPRTVTLTHALQGKQNEVLSATFEIGIPYLYVDAELGDDAKAGTTSDVAVKTLARAYELAIDGCVIFVAAGTYDPVTATGKAVTFRAMDEATIDGGGTARCVTADTDVVFENFTLINGYDATRGGGACGGTFENCTITNCACGGDGGGAFGANLLNCMVVGNAATNGGGGVCAPGTMRDTIFRGNSPENTSGESETVVEDGAFVYASGETAYTIPHAWFVKAGLAKYGDRAEDLAARLKKSYACGLTGWGAYVAGVDPNDTAPSLTADVSISNGLVYVVWSPYMNTNDVQRIYTVSGRADLNSYDWEDTVRPWHRFFKVSVSMPTELTNRKSAAPNEGFEQGELGGVQLWKNGPYWAECNVGATKPEEVGYYFWWGDTVGYTYEGGSQEEGYTTMQDVTWVSSTGMRMSECPFSSDKCSTYQKSISELQELGYIDSSTNLVARCDAARLHVGAPWRMPTGKELKDLDTHTSATYITTNGVCGVLLTGLKEYASRSIFLPASGIQRSSRCYYWSSTPYPWESSRYAYHLMGDSLWPYCQRYSGSGLGFYRYDGAAIRPVRDR